MSLDTNIKFFCDVAKTINDNRKGVGQRSNLKMRSYQPDAECREFKQTLGDLDPISDPLLLKKWIDTMIDAGCTRLQGNGGYDEYYGDDDRGITAYAEWFETDDDRVARVAQETIEYARYKEYQKEEERNRCKELLKKYPDCI